MPLLETLRRTVHAHGLLAENETVLVAVSGGPDSLSLLHALAALQQGWGLAGITAAHLDHGLRGAESAADAAFVAAFCAARGLPCLLGHIDAAALARSQKLSLQHAAREARYRFLEQAAEHVGADKIATAHTQDDQVETVLLNILRGSGVDGLRGIPLRRDRFIRPLRDVLRADVLAYCDTHGLTPRLDSSNLAADHYTRNRLRLELLPELERHYNPAVRQALLRLSEIATRDADYLHEATQTALAEVTMTRQESQWVLDGTKLRAMHSALRHRVVWEALGEIRGTRAGITHEHVDPLCAAVLGERRLPFGLTTPAPACAARVTPRRLTLTTPPATASDRTP